MNIAIIGTGKMGRGFASALSSKHDVVFGTRDPERTRKRVTPTGVSDLRPYSEAATGADLLILAVPWRAIDETLAQLPVLDGTPVIDVTVPHGKDLEALGRHSTGEKVQKKLPGARVVKAWNHVFAQYLTSPEVDGIASSVLLAGDHEEAKAVVARLAREIGFHPVDVGPLRQSFQLDRLVNMMMFVKLGPIRVLSDPL